MAMAAIISLGVDTVDMPQAPRKICVWGLNQEMVGSDCKEGNGRRPEDARIHRPPGRFGGRSGNPLDPERSIPAVAHGSGRDTRHQEIRCAEVEK